MVSPAGGALRALVLCALANGVCAVAFLDHTAGAGTNPAQGVTSPATASPTPSISFMVLSCLLDTSRTWKLRRADRGWLAFVALLVLLLDQGKYQKRLSGWKPQIFDLHNRAEQRGAAEEVPSNRFALCFWTLELSGSRLHKARRAINVSITQERI